jgi:CRP/FNR family cyclic AMP-dependent transcriptional regulator
METVVNPTVGSVIASHGTRCFSAAGEALFLEGDHSHTVYVCDSGRIRIFLTTPSGRELLLGIKRPGEEFGELSALDGRPRSASAVAIEPSFVFKVPGEEFAELLAESADLSVAVLHLMSANLRRANDRLVARNSDSATVRTGNMLVELASLMIKAGGCADRCELPITQADLADWIGATRESTARALAGFRKAGLVETHRGRIVICDVLGLDATIAAA